MSDTAHSVRLLDRAVGAVEASFAPTSSILQRLRALRNRLEQERFQLAALGQFKRGKSSLLNALIGAPVLPIAVVPLTAIPTFIASGPEPSVRIFFRDGRREDHRAKTVEQVRDVLFRFVTEEGNPRNQLEIARVDVQLPSPLLDRGIVLIDTPGVGSTYSHNTDAAFGVLPECDAALFVVSVDPPITEVEVDYLRRIRPHVVRMFFILNKIDYLAAEERRGAEDFLRKTLNQNRLIDSEDSIFSVSARSALAAKQNGDRSGLAESGLSALERHLVSFLVEEKNDALQAAIMQKSLGFLAEAQSELALRLRALELPISDLEARAAGFAEALQGFEAQRRAVRDLLAGERRRLIEELEEEAGRLRISAKHRLGLLLDEANGADIGAAIEPLFDAALRDVSEAFGKRTNAALANHARAIEKLVNAVRQKAAELFSLPFVPAVEEDSFRVSQEPYWVTEKWATTFMPRPEHLLDAILPPGVKRARARGRHLAQLDELITRNVENLRWAIRRSLDDAFRGAATRLEHRLDEATAATQDAIHSALEQKRNQSGETAPEIEKLRRRSNVIGLIRREIEGAREPVGGSSQ